MAYYDPYYPRYKEDCYWYGEWQDMGARIPYCKCKKEHAEIGPNDCENCAEYHSKYKRTNADRIRSMTDEELAKLLDHDCPPRSALDVCPQYESGKPYTQEGCYQCRLAWLKQEVSDAL